MTASSVGEFGFADVFSSSTLQPDIRGHDIFLGGILARIVFSVPVGV